MPRLTKEVYEYMHTKKGGAYYNNLHLEAKRKGITSNAERYRYADRKILEKIHGKKFAKNRSTRRRTPQRTSSFGNLMRPTIKFKGFGF